MNPVTLLSLPGDARFLILLRLDYQALSAMERTSSAMKQFIATRSVWRHITSRDHYEAYRVVRVEGSPRRGDVDGMKRYMVVALDRISLHRRRPHTYWKRFYEYLTRVEGGDFPGVRANMLPFPFNSFQFNLWRLPPGGEFAYYLVDDVAGFLMGINPPEMSLVLELRREIKRQKRSDPLEGAELVPNRIAHSADYLVFMEFQTQSPTVCILRIDQGGMSPFLVSCRVCGEQAKYVEEGEKPKAFCGVECQRRRRMGENKR